MVSLEPEPQALPSNAATRHAAVTPAARPKTLIVGNLTFSCRPGTRCGEPGWPIESVPQEIPHAPRPFRYALDRPADSRVNGHSELPGGGHEFCPLMATRS